MSNWLRRLWPKRESERVVFTSRGVPMNGRAAALEVELRISEAILAISGSPMAATLKEKARDGSRARLLTADGGPAGCVETASGLATSGRRVASFLGASFLSSVAPSLATTAKRLTPMVTHAWFDGQGRHGGHAQWHRLETCGALLAMAATPQEAADLTIAARIASESALCPAVVAVEGVDEEPIAELDWKAIEGALGRPGDSIRCPTPDQIEIFGRKRRRVPSWMDPVHPLAMGMPASAIDAGMISAGRSALFGEDLARLVRASLAQARDLLGRPMGLIRRHMLDDAEVVLVAQGSAVPMAEEVAGELRTRKGWRVGVAGITWISPFPASDLAADLGGRRAVFVVERTNAFAGDEPPLLRRVRAAVRDRGTPVVSVISTGTPIKSEALMAVCSSNLERVFSRKGKDQKHAGLDHRVRLDIPCCEVPSALPKREALETRVQASHPELVAQVQSTIRSLCEITTPAEQGGERDGAGVSSKQPPELLRRIGRSRIAPDSLPRAWGELLEPRHAGPWPRLPDPLTASTAVPALASALLPRGAQGKLPSVRLDGCTGCGHCWTACPEGAIGVTVTSLVSLLDGASRLANTSGPVADALRRAHSHIAKRAAGRIEPDYMGPLLRALLQDAWLWVSGKLGIEESEVPEYEAAFEATLDRLESLLPVVTDRFFHTIVDEARAAELLILAIDPDACTGCGLCAAECPETVIELRDPDLLAPAARTHFQAWETLDDTSGKTCARAAADPEVGEMAARLLSRHCSFAMVGTGLQPGSGERLALRHTVAVTEQYGQRRAASLANMIEEERAALDEKLRGRLSANLMEAEIAQLTSALQAQDVSDMSTFAEALGHLGERTTLDRRYLLELAELSMQLRDIEQEILSGPDGLGRARYLMAIGGTGLAERIAPYPHHPFFAPLVVDASISSGSMAIGLAEAQAQRQVEIIRAIRRAAIEAESPPDRPGRLAELERLSWKDLSIEERASCPPLLFVMDETFLARSSASFITRLLSGDLPIKVILLDGLQPDRRPDPVLLAIAHQRTYVLSSSIGSVDHFASGFEEALAHPGTAFVHLHAPAPDIHGFAADAAIERARAAVAARAHVLAKYDPSAEGALGLRLSLDGNPCLEAEEAALSLTDWAAGESRFGKAAEDLDPEAHDTVKEKWLALLELSGRGGLLRSRLEAELREKLSFENEAALAAKAAELDDRIAEAVARAEVEARERLTDRLVAMTLAARATAGEDNEQGEREQPSEKKGREEAS